MKLSVRLSRQILITICCFGPFLVGAGCQEKVPAPEVQLPNPIPTGEPWFEEVAENLQLDFVHVAGFQVDPYFMPRVNGAGSALFDYDNDGLLDVYLLQNGGPDGPANRLFRQQADHTFVDATAGSGLDVSGWGMGVTTGDVNNDGHVDLAVFEYGRTRLFLNEGEGHFVDVSETAGLVNPLWGMSGVFFDYDRDGWLDLFIANYVDYDPSWPCSSTSGRRAYCSPSVFTGTVSKLFHNIGQVEDAGTSTRRVRFEDVTVASGIGRKIGPGLAVHSVDFTNDGWPDVLVANDQTNNELWVNQRDGTFQDEAVVRGLACNAFGRSEADMGIALGDVDANGHLDVFITHLNIETHTLWMQDEPGLFTDRTPASGLAPARGTGFGTALGDFDLDGDLDLVVATGAIRRGDDPLGNPKLGEHWSVYAEPNQVLRNDDGHFVDISARESALCGQADVARGLAVGDLDNDGRLDLVVTCVDAPVKALINRAPRRGHWLAVRAIDPTLKRDAFGAIVQVAAGGRQWMRVIQTAGSYACASDALAHFGLGEVTEIEQIEVRWPDGLIETFTDIDVDVSVTLRRGEGQAATGNSR